MSGKDVEALPLYNVRQKETVDDVIVNPQLSAEQKNQVKDLLVEYNEIFSDVPKMTHLIEHKVELTESEPVKKEAIPYTIQDAGSHYCYYYLFAKPHRTSDKTEQYKIE